MRTAAGHYLKAGSRAGAEAGRGSPARAMHAARPSAFIVAVFPPVLGPAAGGAARSAQAACSTKLRALLDNQLALCCPAATAKVALNVCLRPYGVRKETQETQEECIHLACTGTACATYITY